MSVSQKLRELSKSWKKIESIKPSFSSVPDGEYVCQLTGMEISESKKSGRLQVVSSFMIVDGEHDGHTIKRFDGIDNETSIGFFKGYCEVLGIDLPEDPENLQDVLNEFVDNNTSLFEVVVKSNKEGYQNVYVNGPSDMILEEDQKEEISDEEIVEEVDDEEDDEDEDEENGEEEESEVKLPSKIFSNKKKDNKPNPPVPPKKLSTGGKNKK